MDALTVSLELAAIKEKTRRLALWSLMVHAAGVILFLALASQPHLVEDEIFVITEITWLEPTPEMVAAPTQASKTAVALVEEMPAHEPPARGPSVELVQQRLAELRAGNQTRQNITATVATPTGRHSDPATLGSFAPRPEKSGRHLNRAAVRPVSRLAALPKEQPSVVAAAVTAIPEAPRGNPHAPAQEIQPGISLAGEVSDRRLIAYLAPEYPEWAKRDGVEVSVELFFTVLPSGQIKENVLIERTSGFDDFDRRAKAALAAWRFESLAAGTAAEQWGRIEFKYRLRDSG